MSVRLYAHTSPEPERTEEETVQGAKTPLPKE